MQMKKVLFYPLTVVLLFHPSMGRADEESPQAEPRQSTASFIRELHDKPRADFSDALRIIQTLQQNKDTAAKFEACRLFLMDKNVIPRSWTYRKDSPITQSMVAYMVCNTLKIEGGVTMRLFGNSERYAMRECIHIGLITDAKPKQYVTGKELLAIFSRAELYKKNGDLESLK